MDEGGLARNISALRKALGDDPSGQRFIETVPKRGYRFVGEVKRLALQLIPRQNCRADIACRWPSHRSDTPTNGEQIWILVSIGLVFVTSAALGLLSRR